MDNGNMGSRETNAFIRQLVFGAWWVVLLRGLVVILLGILLIARPSSTIQVLAQLVGAFLAVDGILGSLLAVRGRDDSIGWRTALIRGVLIFLVGVLVVVLPQAFVTVAGLVLIYLAAAALLVNGILGVIRAVRVRSLIPDEWSMIAGGVLQAVMGLILALAPVFFGVLFLVILGVTVTIGGVVMTAVAFRMRRLSR